MPSLAPAELLSSAPAKCNNENPVIKVCKDSTATLRPSWCRGIKWYIDKLHKVFNSHPHGLSKFDQTNAAWVKPYTFMVLSFIRTTINMTLCEHMFRFPNIIGRDKFNADFAKWARQLHIRLVFIMWGNTIQFIRSMLITLSCCGSLLHRHLSTLLNVVY